MNSIVRSLFIFIICSLPLYAQQPTLKDTLLDKMTGNWLLEGKIAGKSTIHDIEAKWVLNHQYVLVHEISHEKNDKGEPEYEANVYVGWDQQSGEYICMWIDIWGGVSASTVGRSKPHGNEIQFVFRDSSGIPSFHTTFVYNKEADTWQWLMDNDDNGKLQSFARVTLKRQ
jgi:hypothetical protein